MQALKSNKWLLLSSLLYIVISGYLIWNDLSYLTLFPIGLIAIYLAVFHSKVIYLGMAFMAPLSINIEEYSDRFGLYLPTEPLLFGLLLLVVMQEIRKSSLPRALGSYPMVWALSFYLFWMFVTSITSVLPVASFKFFLAHLWLVVPMVVIGFSVFAKKKAIIVFFWLFTIGMAITIVYTVTIHATYRFGEQESHWVMWPFFKDHTIYGAAIGLVVPVVFGLYFYKKHTPIVQAVLIALIAVILVGLYFSYTRAAWLSVVAAVAVWALIRLKIKFSWLLGIGIAGLLIIASSWTAIQHSLEKNTHEHTTEDFGKRIQSAANVSTDASNLERLNRWQCAIDMFMEKPFFGFGPGTYAFEYASFQRPENLTIISTTNGDGGNAHSEYLGIMAESGLFGLLSMLFLVGAIFYQSITLYVKWPVADKKTRTIIMAIILSLVTYFVHAFLNNYLDSDKASVPIYGMCAMILALEYKYRTGLLEQESEW